MEIAFSKNTIKLSRVLSLVDNFTIEFIRILDKLGIKYVIVSGYTALLFGRERITEDIDILFSKEDLDRIEKLYSELSKEYWVLNAESVGSALRILREGSGIRIAKNDSISPNIEFKIGKNEYDDYSLKNPTNVIVNGTDHLKISPFELQIPYKLYLGSRKDIEDARFLFNIFKNHVDKEKMKFFSGKLKVMDKIKYLGEI